MTIEEAIENLKESLRQNQALLDDQGIFFSSDPRKRQCQVEETKKRMDALTIVISALGAQVQAAEKTHLTISKTEEDQEGICPVCGGELELEDNIQMDDGGVYPWKCLSCGATGKQGYAEIFDGNHYDVRDADGNLIQGREQGE